MNTKNIKVMIVDDVAKMRSDIKRLLQFEADINVIGEAEDGASAIKLAKKLQPDCILMDINMPGMDGITATERIYQELPHCVIIIISVQGEHEYLRKAMMAGARDYLAKPFNGNELVSTIRSVWDIERARNYQYTNNNIERQAEVITVFSAKGGVGKTTIATNLAVCLANQQKNVILMDLDLQFGDIPIMLNLKAKKSIIDWYEDELSNIEDYLLSHESGVKILAAPEIPERGELITAEHINQMITELKPKADFVIVDTPQFFQDTTLQILELANSIFLVVVPDLVNLKNAGRCLNLLGKLDVGDKVKIIANKVMKKDTGIRFQQFKSRLGVDIEHQLSYDPRLTAIAAAQGNPAVNVNAKAKLSREIIKLAQHYTQASDTLKNDQAKQGSFLRLLASRRG